MHQIEEGKSSQAVIYLRVSTEEQVENYSLETQLDICVKEAERRGLGVLKVFREEGRSAKTIKGRPTLIEMLEFCRKNKKDVRAIIVYRLDRLSRQTADYLAIRKKLAEVDIVLISATEPTGNTPTEKFIETMLAGFAQMDNDVRSERTKNGMRARFLAGLHTGTVPIGYLNQNGYIAKDPEKYSLMKEAWELMATGTKSLQAMADFLNEKGLREQRKGHKEYPIRPQTLNNIFRNKFYVGKLVSRKYGDEAQGQHTPMITEAQFYQVQAALDGRNRNLAPALARRNFDSTEFPLRRLVKCSVCGHSLTAGWSKGKLKRYAYYCCQKRCKGSHSIAKEKLHEETATELQAVSLRPKTIELLNAFLRRTYYLRTGSLQKKREKADEDLKKYYELRQALVEKNLSGVYSDSIFKEQNKMLEDKIKTVQIAKNDSVIEKYSLAAITEFIATKFKDLNETYENGSLEEKRTLLCSIFPSGLQYRYPGYSNTPKSPFYQAILELQENNIQFGAPEGIRTPGLLIRSQSLYPLSYGRMRALGQSGTRSSIEYPLSYGRLCVFYWNIRFIAPFRE